MNYAKVTLSPVDAPPPAPEHEETPFRLLLRELLANPGQWFGVNGLDSEDDLHRMVNRFNLLIPPAGKRGPNFRTASTDGYYLKYDGPKDPDVKPLGARSRTPESRK